MELSKQEYWNGLPFPTPGHLPNPGTESTSLLSPALAGRFFTAAPPGKRYIRTFIIGLFSVLSELLLPEGASHLS